MVKQKLVLARSTVTTRVRAIKAKVETKAVKAVKAVSLALCLATMLALAPLTIMGAAVASLSTIATLAYSPPAKAELNHEQKSKQAHEFILKNGTAMIKIMGDKKMSNNKKRQLLKNILEKNLNTHLMTRAIIGKYWRQMDEKQRQKYTLVASQWIVLYSANLLSTLNSTRLEVVATKPIGKDVLVETNVREQKNTPPIPIDWRVRIDKEEQVSLIDMHIRGLSMVSAQRGEAQDILAESGLEGFLYKLEERFQSMKKEFQKNS